MHAPVLTLKFVVTEAEAPKTEPELKIADKATALGFIVEDNTCTYNMELSDGKAEFEFAPFWSFVLNDKEITDLSIDPALEESDFGYKVSFDKADTYTYTIKATGYDAPVLTLKFVVTEAEAPKTEPELKIADKATALGFIVEDNTCTYNMELSNGKAEFEFAPFWSFVLNDKEITDLSIDPALEESDFGYKVSFDKADTYTYEIKAIKTAADEENEAVLYDAPVLTLKFVVTEAKPEITVDLTTNETDEFTMADEKFTFAGDFEETEDDEGNCKFTATFKPFWNFKLGEDAVAYEIYNKDGSAQTVEKDGENGTLAIDFTESGEHTYTVKAVDAEGTPYENAPYVTLVFDAPEHEELPTVEYDEDVWSKYFTKSEEDENTFIYNDKLEFTAGSSCTARFEPFYSFKLDSLAEGQRLFSSLKITDFECAHEPNDILALTFSEEGDYNVVVTSALYKEVIGEDSETNYEYIKGYNMPAVTLKFHVTKFTPAPVYPDPVFPVDPVTPAPTATPAPTETPAPTDAPTDAPTSEPTVAPDVEMQVSAGGKRLNVRSGAGIGNSIIARLNDGAKVTVLLVEGDWSYIRATVNGNVIEGYVSSQYLKEISTVEPTEPANARVSTSGSALRLRSRASLNAPIITRMPNGSSLKVLETVNGWCRVQFTAANGTVHEGWASSQYITVIA